MSARTSQFDSSFALQWWVSSAVGLFFGGMLAIGAFWSIGTMVERSAGATTGFVIGGAIMGACFALGSSVGPALLLDRRGVSAAAWLVGSVLSATLGMALFMGLLFSFVSRDSTPPAAGGLVLGLALGLSVGLGQWMALRGRGLHAAAWPLVSALAFGVALFAGLPLGGEGREWIALSVIALLAAAIAAAGMTWLLQQPRGNRAVAND